MENLVTIGQFAETTGVSPKALRLYETNGLLRPTRVDADSGYRYYRPEQVHTARMIGLLRSAGMPLREIRRFIALGDTDAVDVYERRLEVELAERREVLRHVRRILEEAAVYEVDVKQVSEQRYASRTASVRVPELEPFIVQTIGELSEGANGAPFAVYHGAVNEVDDGPVEVGVPRADGDKLLPAAEVAFTTVRGEQCEFPQILGAYEALSRWIKDNERQTSAPPREVYLSAPGEPLEWEIVWQLR